MKYRLILFLYLAIFISCDTQQRQNRKQALDPIVKPSKGLVVPKNQISAPVIYPAGPPRMMLVGTPKIVATNTNIHALGSLEKVLAGTPRISTPGLDSFSMPMVYPAKDSSFVAGIPEQILAKDPAVKDQNAQNFSSFGKLQGLKNAYVFCMLEDKMGNLWFGTDGGGVSKYDGQSFTHYTAKEGLSSNNVFCLGTDRVGNIWIGTFGGGISKYDGKNFTNYTEKDGLSSNNVFSILQDRSGNMWFGTYGGGVSKYNGSTFTHYTTKEGLSGNVVYSIIEDQHGHIWFATYGAGISKFDGTSFTQYTTSEGMSSNLVWILKEDRHGNIWMGTDGKGALKYDGKFFTRYTETDGLSGNNVFNILEDNVGNIWFATYGGGACKFDGTSFTHFTEKEGLSNNIVYALLEDKSENLWFGTFGGGVSRYDGKLFTHFTDKEGLSNSVVYSIAEDKHGTIWFGTFGGGISKYDPSMVGAFTHYTPKEGIPGTINSIVEDQRGHLWFGTDGQGVIRYDPSATKIGRASDKVDDIGWLQYTTQQGLSNNLVRTMHEDKKGNLWFGTYGGGVSKYDGSTFTHITTKEGLSNDFILSIYEDNKGVMWFGTFGGGVTKYDLQDTAANNESSAFTHFTVDQGMLDNHVRSITEDKQGNMWFGTGAGVSMYDRVSFTHFTVKQGLADDVVYSILEDHQGNLWFGTRVGLSKLTPAKFSSFLTRNKVDNNNRDNSLSSQEDNLLFKNYTYEDGFLGVGCFANAICEDKQGTIWIGANDRLTAYHPDGDLSDTLAPKIQLSGISLFNEKVNWLELGQKKDTSFTLGNGVLVGDFRFDGVTKWYNVPEHLNLAYNNNYLNFNFIGISIKSPEKVKYRYKLEGLDEHWSVVSSRTDAPYGNLPPGHYTFKVKAMNGEGYWSEENQFPFTIRPPWWLTWWAYSIYLVAFIGSILGYISYRSAALLKTNRHLEDQVKVRTSQLQTSLEHLKSTQTQLIQSEKMASLGELTAGIAHEIQNPLNFVNNFSSINVELIDEMQQELTTGNGQDAIALSKDIKGNELKIMHHGKRVEGIVKGMLQHSQKSTGAKELTDINALIKEWSRLAHQGYKAKDNNFECKISLELDPSLPKVDIVPQDIGRVLLNVLNNAFWAVGERSKRQSVSSPNGSLREKTHSVLETYTPTVTLITNLATGKNLDTSIEIRIVDNGIGIPDSIKDKIFQPFFTTKPTGQGTGLGLSLSYDIVKAHGGTIEVKSYGPPEASITVKNNYPAEGEINLAVNPYEGSEFTITLPFKTNEK